MKDASETNEKKVMFLTKFIFSALIDADRTNTRLFEENKTSDSVVNHKGLFIAYYERLSIASVASFVDASIEIQVESL
ncbi:hypothetical protein [Bacillus sp. V59.32b]|uniref:hypothetical protein n=1 Tax=Bacillus sp. V59.32b TaxID=1758642 RepID=UPI000E3ED744|nr:hypothetical protein D0463_05840 [Bacillus sp. V59.32b]